MGRSTARITIERVNALEPGEIAWDSEVRGFCVRRRASAITYFLKTRVRGRQLWLRIGDSGAWSPSAARTEAKRLLTKLPGTEQPELLRLNPRGQATVSALCDRYLAEHMEIKNKASTKVGFRRLVDVEIRPRLGTLLVTDVTMADIERLHRKLARTPRQANQAVSVLSKMFSLAERWQLRRQGTNPCRGLERYREVARTRVLTPDELARLGATLAAMERAGELMPGVALAFRLAAFTGCRIGEVLALRWDDVDLERGALQIRDAKAGGRVHFIGDAAIALLAAAVRTEPFVCWSTKPAKAAPMGSVQKVWRTVRKKAGIADVRLHDLRHGFGTAAADSGANAFAVRDALGHKTLAMTGRYVNRRDAPQRQLANEVAATIAAAMNGTEKCEKATHVSDLTTNAPHGQLITVIPGHSLRTDEE